MGAFGTAACAVYEPPGGGTPKGCIQDVVFDAPVGNGLGVSSHVEWGDDARQTAYRTFEAGEWSSIGVRQVRTDLTWARIEPTRGTFDWAGPDRVVETIENAGAELLAILDYGNGWAVAGSDDSLRPPDDVTDFGSYAEAVATRYRGRVRQYEIWNEPNLGLAFWHPVEDPEAYGELLVEASARIRAVDPDARVSFGGVFQPRLVGTAGEEFIEQVHAAVPDLADHIDALAFHPYRYPFTAPEHESDAQRSLVDTTCRMRALADVIGGAELALWNTELGWHTAFAATVTGVEPDEAAAYLARSALLSFAHGVERFAWYTFRDSGVDVEDQEQQFGLYAFDDDPTTEPSAVAKPAVAAFAALSQALGGHRRIEDRSELLGLDADTYAYRLSGGVGETYAVWTTSTEVTVLIPDPDSAGGALEVTAGPSPTYVQLPGP